MIYLGNGTYCCFLDLSDEYKSSVMYQHLTGTASACYKICAEEEEATRSVSVISVLEQMHFARHISRQG